MNSLSDLYQTTIQWELQYVHIYPKWLLKCIPENLAMLDYGRHSCTFCYIAYTYVYILTPYLRVVYVCVQNGYPLNRESGYVRL